MFRVNKNKLQILKALGKFRNKRMETQDNEVKHTSLVRWYFLLSKKCPSTYKCQFYC